MIKKKKTFKTTLKKITSRRPNRKKIKNFLYNNNIFKLSEKHSKIKKSEKFSKFFEEEKKKKKIFLKMIIQ